MEFSRRNKRTFYLMRMGEALVVGILLSLIFSLTLEESLIMIIIGIISTPVGIGYAKSLAPKDKKKSKYL